MEVKLIELFFRAIAWLVVGFFKLVIWFFRTLGRGIGRLVRGAPDRQDYSAEMARGKDELQRQPQAVAKRSAQTGAGRAPARGRTQHTAAVDTLDRTLADLERRARALADRCAGEAENERFVSVLRGYVPQLGAEAHRILVDEGDAGLGRVGRQVEQLTVIVELIMEMAEQRRDADKLLLLGDSDALADACYGPVVQFARGQGIALASDRAATLLGDKDLAIFLGFLPTRLAPIVLPAAWSTEIGWWPALAHEIGHDFHASVSGLDAELRRRLSLPPPAPLPDANEDLTKRDLDVAFAVWLPEIFADAFGTLMLGPAYVTTMMWSFARPDKPRLVVTAAPSESGSYEEHPPGHLRVVLGCRLLSRIGFDAEARALEAEWRKQHKMPGTIFLPTRQRSWFEIDEAPFVERGVEIAESLYEEGYTALAGVPLRSIPGLDLGPREHQAAVDAKQAFLDGEPAETRDPRCLIAGAVLAWKQRPSASARILRAARATIPAVGVSRRSLRLRAEQAAARSMPSAAFDIDVLRDAFVLGEALAPPPGSRVRRPII